MSDNRSENDQIAAINTAVWADPTNKDLPSLETSTPHSIIPYLGYFTSKAAEGHYVFEHIYFLTFCLSRLRPGEVDDLLELGRRMDHLASVLANPEDHVSRYVREERRLAKEAQEEEESEESLRIRWESGLRTSLSDWFDEFQVGLQKLR